MKIVSQEKQPSTNNDWGFGGAENITHITMENGDVWRTGTACQRHQPDIRFIRLVESKHTDYKVDAVLTTSPMKWLQSFYNK
jgi:hypothetical protein